MRHLVPLVLLLTAAAPAPRVTAITPIPLHAGVNTVPRFLPDGGTATIVEGWRGNGNAHGYHVWMVLTGPSEGNPVGIATFESKGGGDTITDNPFDGERVIGSIRFARARIDGHPASVLLSARLDDDADKPLADHERATITVYRLTEHDGIGPPLSFDPIATERSEKRYCNADLALRDALGVALPADFAGPNRVDGCFPG